MIHLGRKQSKLKTAYLSLKYFILMYWWGPLPHIPSVSLEAYHLPKE